MKRALGWVALGASLLGCAETPPPVAPSPPVVAPPSPAAEPPAPAGDPAPVTEGQVTVGTVHGVQVLVKRVPGELVAAKLCIRGGARNIDEKTAGVENLAINVAASGGTKTLDKSAFARKLASLGAHLGGGSGNDFATFEAKVPNAGFDETFGLLVAAFRSPALPASELEVARQRVLAELHHEAESPDGRLWTLERKQLFAGHPYANRPVGTLETVPTFRASDLAAHLEKLRETSRLVVVVVGDVDPAHVFDLVSGGLGDLPKGTYVDTPIPPLGFDKSRLVTEQRAMPTNYVTSAFVAPRHSEPDYIVGMVAISGLSHRLWDELRTKRNLTYSVYSYIDGGLGRPLGQLSVTAVDPNAAMKVMLDEVRRLQTEPLPDAELAGFKSVFLTGHLQGRELVDSQAYGLAEAHILGGDWHLAQGIPERVRAVTAADVQAFAKKYLTHLQAAVLGDPAKVDAGLFTSF